MSTTTHEVTFKPNTLTLMSAVYGLGDVFDKCTSLMSNNSLVVAAYGPHDVTSIISNYDTMRSVRVRVSVKLLMIQYLVIHHQVIIKY